MLTFLCSLTIIFFFVFSFVPQTNADSSSYKVLKVVDGDTIVVDIRGMRETVRLLGIDTPETDPRGSVECFGNAATDKMKSFVEGRSVILVDDKTQGDRDRYGRLLRYVYLPDPDGTFVNGEMVKQGYAFSYRKYPTKMLEEFNEFERQARENELGLWGTCTISSPPSPTLTLTPTPQVKDVQTADKAHEDELLKKWVTLILRLLSLL